MQLVADGSLLSFNRYMMQGMAISESLGLVMDQNWIR